jgi:uncharacterized alkaline shock family protein YloU
MVTAHHTLTVPGVSALQPRLTQAVGGLTDRWRYPQADRDQPPTGGVVVTITDDTIAEITIDVVLFLGTVFPDVAGQIQRQVAAAVKAATGLASVISINIVDVTDDRPDPTGRPEPADADRPEHA